MKISYQVLIVGIYGEAAAEVEELTSKRLGDLGIPPHTVGFLHGDEIVGRNRKVTSIALFFGGVGSLALTDHLDALIQDSIVIVPVTTAAGQFGTEIPPVLKEVNGIALTGVGGGVNRIVSLILELFGLLRRERRLFISYKRDDAQETANALYDALDKRGFDVFIDVRSVPPAEDFQAVLWHRMADSDVVILLDTPNFRTSRWTTAELAQANATEVQILHVLWPGQAEDPECAFNHYVSLDNNDFEAGNARGRVRLAVLDDICEYAEQLRARAMAARHRYLVDNFCDAARVAGYAPAVQPERWISIKRSSGDQIAIVPAVGVPTAERINGIADAMDALGGAFSKVWMIYDNRGLAEAWLKHLDWLHQHLPVKGLRMSEVTAGIRAIDHD
ncbi:MAG: toll/interleukin-1 receptor domain-containing protein [Neoaquamicrobium sediminum]|uniref:toll/interleukin-1 receptor domain-containing protein n=1 Tax=Neoaquamicrobium sediminum TaxID=1849104 RepID=UPI004036EA19